MASYLRPRRGRKSTAISQNIVLKRGEIFMEVPETGVGTGIGKIKIGDGTTAYSNLPYFINSDAATVDVASEVINYSEASTVESATTDIVSGKPLKTIIAGLKKLVLSAKASAESVEMNWLSGTYNGDEQVLYWSSANYPFINADSVFKVYATKFGKMPQNMEVTLDGGRNNVRFNLYFKDNERFDVLVCVQNPTAS